MRRRTVLAAFAALSTGSIGSLAGCLADDPATNDELDSDDEPSESEDDEPPDSDDNDEHRDPASFEECSRLVVRYDELPEPARAEVDAAIDGKYETDEEPYLPNLIAPESYVRVEEREYAIDVEETDGTTRLVAEEAIPTRGRSLFRVENPTDDRLEVTVTVRRLRDEEVVLDAEATIESRTSEAVGAFDRVFGRYEATVVTDALEGTVAWTEEEMSMPLEGVVVDDEEIIKRPRAVLEPIDCRGVWGLD